MGAGRPNRLTAIHGYPLAKPLTGYNYVQPSADLSLQHSFHREVWSYGRLLLSIPLVQLCAAQTPNPRRARFRALRLRCAPGIDSASLRSIFANCETNVFYWPAKAKFFRTRSRSSCLTRKTPLISALRARLRTPPY